MSGYEKALKAAGAAVFAYETFGDYTGSWLALCFYEGEFRWVCGAYGSCSGCDAFQAEFDFVRDEEEESEHEYQRRLAAFGKTYLDDYIEDLGKYMDRLKERSEWDSGADEIIKFIDSYPLTEAGKIKLVTDYMMKETGYAN